MEVVDKECEVVCEGDYLTLKAERDGSDEGKEEARAQEQKGKLN